MKAQIWRTIALVICLFPIGSCSEDENQNIITPPQAENFLLIKKVTQTTYYSSTDFETSVSDFTYEGNKLLNIHYQELPEAYNATFNYDGLKISSIDYYHLDGSSYGNEVIFYSGDVIHHTLSLGGLPERTDYTFVDGHIATRKRYSPASSPNPTLLEARTYTYTNGNLSELYIDNNSSSFPNLQEIYTYDNKNNPLRGMNKYLQLIIKYEGFDGLSVNNPLTRTSYFPVGETDPDESHYEIIYNAQNYPTHITRFSENNSLESDTIIEYLEQ